MANVCHARPACIVSAAVLLHQLLICDGIDMQLHVVHPLLPYSRGMYGCVRVWSSSVLAAMLAFCCHELLTVDRAVQLIMGWIRCVRSAFSACLFYGSVLASQAVFWLRIANNSSFLLDYLPICHGYKCLYCLPHAAKCGGQGWVVNEYIITKFNSSIDECSNCGESEACLCHERTASPAMLKMKIAVDDGEYISFYMAAPISMWVRTQCICIAPCQYSMTQTPEREYCYVAHASEAFATLLFHQSLILLL